MARRDVFSNSFSAGEIASELLMRADLQTRNEALKQARNIRIVQGGGFKRRPGTIDLGGLPSDSVVYTLGVGDDDARVLVFYIGGFQERDLDGNLLADVTAGSPPWTDIDRLRSIKVAAEQDRIIVSSRSFFPVQIVRSGATWTISNLAFAGDFDGGLRQPYWRYAPKDVTIAPSGYSGSVTVTASADTFSASWVDYRLRYAGVELVVTAFTDAKHITATVLGQIYPTVSVTLGDSSGFTAGQQVSGEDTQIQGVVAAVPDGTHITVQLLGSYSLFSSTEKLIGPTSFSTISAVAASGAPAPTLDWDEAMMTPARGYPGTCGIHHSRLLFGDFPNAKNAIAASAIGDLTDFDVGTGADTDAIVDTVGSDATLGVRHFGSTEQLIVLTEAGPHYVPEQVAAPFSATNLELLQIGPEAAGQPAPVLASEGILFCEDRSGRLMIALPTGNVRRSWDIADLSELAYHLMGKPVELELLAASSQSDRMVCSLRDDGQLAAMSYRRNDQVDAWSLWTTTGQWRSITAAGGKLYAVSKRNVGGLDVFRLERFEEGVWGDGTVFKPAGSATHLNGATVGVWVGTAKIGSRVVSSGGVTGLPAGVSDHAIGFDFPLTAEIVPPVDSTVGLSRKIRICRAWLDVIQAVNLKVNGYTAVGYSNQGGLGGAIAPFSGQITYFLSGRSRDQTLLITQVDGGPAEVRSLSMEVTS